MSAPAAFKATFSDFRLIKGRKVAQLIFELPIEGCDAALEAMGGVPQPHEERWAAIARIDLKAVSAAPEPLKERRSWSDLSYAQQAGIRCNEPDFWKFIGEVCDVGTFEDIKSPEGAASFVRIHCNVESRAHIKPNTPPGIRWRDLDVKYEAWQREREYR